MTDPGGWQYKLILSCVHGKQDLVDVEDLEKGAEGSQNKSDRSGGDAKKLLICVVGKCVTDLVETLKNC